MNTDGRSRRGRVAGYVRNNAVAFLALFVALGGTGAYAANEWTGSNIQNESLTGADVRGLAGTSTTAATNGSLTGADISGQRANPAVGQPEINGSLTTYDVADGSLRGLDVADGSITGADVNEATLKGLAPVPSKIVWHAPVATGVTKLATAGPWTVWGACVYDDFNSELWLQVDIQGGGEAQWAGGESSNDGAVTPQHGGMAMPDSSHRYGLLTALTEPPAFSRVDRTAYLRSGATLAEVQLNGYADLRPDSKGCHLLGHAVLLG